MMRYSRGRLLMLMIRVTVHPLSLNGLYPDGGGQRRCLSALAESRTIQEPETLRNQLDPKKTRRVTKKMKRMKPRKMPLRGSRTGQECTPGTGYCPQNPGTRTNCCCRCCYDCSWNHRLVVRYLCWYCSRYYHRILLRLWTTLG